MSITFELGQIQLTDYDDADVLRAQPDAFGEEPKVASHQLLHFLGLAARGNDPEIGPDGKALEGSGTLALIVKDGTDRFVIPLGDPRDLAKLPRLKKGERMLYGSAANFARCHADGAVTCFTTTDGTLNGKSVYSQVRPDGFLMVAPWGKLTFDANGFHMLHSSGARLDAGAIGGLPAPLDQLGSYFKIAAASVQIEAAMVAMGTVAGVADAAAKATPTVAALAAIGTALTAIQASLAAMVPGLIPAVATTAATPVGASATAVTAAVALTAAATTTVPSSTTVT